MVKKRSISIAGHPTSISLEDDFWDALSFIAKENKQSLASLVTMIDKTREGNLSSALRLYALNYYKKKANIA